PLPRRDCDAGVVARPELVGMGPSVRQWRAAVVRFLHDLGPDDDSEPLAWQNRACRDHHWFRIRLAVRFLPHERPAMGAFRAGAGGSAVGRGGARDKIKRAFSPG